MASKLSRFLAEFKRRKVGRVAVLYVLVGLGAIEAVDIIGSRLLFPDWAIQFVIVLVLIGFPIALVLAWALEVTPQGIQQTADLTPEQLASQTPDKWRASSWVLSGVALVVVLGAGYFVFLRGSDGDTVDAGQRRVAVLPLENLTGDPSLDRLGRMAADWITEGLVGADLFQVVPFNEVLLSSEALSISGSPASTLELTWPEETGATLAILGAYSVLGDSIEFRLRIVDTEGTALRAVDPVMGVAANPSVALGGLQVRAVSSLAREIAPGHELATSAMGHNPPDPDAHEAYLEGVASGAGRVSLGHHERALELDPGYLAPLMLIPPSLRNLRRYEAADSVCQVLESRSGDFTREDRGWVRVWCGRTPLGQLQAAKTLADEFPMALYSVILYGVRSNRPHDAIDACSRYDPGLSRVVQRWARPAWSFCTSALHMLGDYEGQLEFIEEKRESYPGAWKPPETDALIALERFDEADQLIEDSLAALGPHDNPVAILNRAASEYDTHGQPEQAREWWTRSLQWLTSRPRAVMDSTTYRRQRAETLLFLGRNEEARELLEVLAEENPDSLADRGRLGIARARLGDRVSAEQLSETLPLMGRPFRMGDPYLWSAAIAANLGDLDRAVQLLDRAIEDGLYVALNLHRNAYLKPLRGYEPFERLMEPKG